MLEISFPSALIFISALWCLVRAVRAIRRGRVDLSREIRLLLSYACIIVIVRFTFFPFSTVDGHVQPLIFDSARLFPPRLNLIPLVNIFRFPTTNDLIINVVGNVVMFIPLGIVWPSLYRGLNTHARVLLSGVGFSLLIELLQLPFYTRVTDVDDLLLNSLGFALGYTIFLLIRHFKKKRNGDSLC